MAAPQEHDASVNGDAGVNGTERLYGNRNPHALDVEIDSVAMLCNVCSCSLALMTGLTLLIVPFFASCASPDCNGGNDGQNRKG